MAKACVKKKMKGGMSRKAAIKACYSDTAKVLKSVAKGAAVGAATAGAAGVQGGRGKTVRKGKGYRGAVAGGALMGAIAGYGEARRKKKKKK